MSWFEKAFLPVYLLGAVATFGFVAAEQERRIERDPRYVRNDYMPPSMKGAGSALIWPVYLPLRLSWSFLVAQASSSAPDEGEG